MFKGFRKAFKQLITFLKKKSKCKIPNFDLGRGELNTAWANYSAKIITTFAVFRIFNLLSHEEYR